ncbi:hypothetical protein GH714_013543 [Hevea brasiliensis]|uniref:non-specific serine/threonine protein kinase n=1 Tax=Hevea brasiliensis TaxID=3981 RepID=A0A6A6MNN2_HEVBR|nr:hypothetical protein GH714_013543 [Hevea brasiliensis]
MQPNLLQAMAVFFIFIFMTIILNIRNPTRVFAQADEQSRNCSSSFQCGNLSGVAYPFWGSNQPSYCGHLGFQLNCKGQAAEITIMNLTYQVLKINSQSQTLTVARADYIANLCPSVLSNTTLDPNLFTYAADIQNITLFYGCPNTNMSFPTTPGFSSPFSCNLSSVNSQNFYLTRHADSFPTVISTYLRTCGSRLIVPANQSVVQRIESNPTEENLVEVLEQGFGLQWTANDTLCKSCELSGGLCGYNSTASAFTCYCPGQRYPFTCATSSAKDGMLCSGFFPEIYLQEY